MKLTMSKAQTLWLLQGWLETGTCLKYGGPKDYHPNLDIRFDP
jgi:hypothetical protein